MCGDAERSQNDTHDRSGSVLAQDRPAQAGTAQAETRRTTGSLPASDARTRDAQAIIDRIIAANLQRESGDAAAQPKSGDAQAQGRAQAAARGATSAVADLDTSARARP